MRFLLLAFLLCLPPLSLQAADALSGDTIQMDDGRVLRLLGIKAAREGDKAALQSLIANHTIAVESGSSPDHYGRIAGDVYAQTDKGKSVWLQGAMLEQGLAFVYPPKGDEPHLEQLFKAEQIARKAKRGIWNDPAFADQAAEPPRMGYGHFAFIRGKVEQAERVKNMVYLNFGADWRTDFTIAIAAHDLHLFKKAGIDPLAYQGKTIRVRGWVKSSGGPMITVTHPAQIETLGEAPATP